MKQETSAETLTWLRRAGEMAGRIRAHDWATTPLGPIAERPRNLRSTVQLILESDAIMVAPWENGTIAGILTILTETTTRVDAARQRQAAEERRDLALQAAEMGAWDYDLVADVCHFDARAQQMYSLPSDALDHRPEGVAAVFWRDVTDRKRAELNLAFLDSVTADLARQSTPDEIMGRAAVRIGVFLRLSGCVFCDVAEAEDEITVHNGWTTEGVPGLNRV